MIEINGKKYRNAVEQVKYLNKCKKLLDLIYDCYEKEDFDTIKRLLDIYGFNSVEELEDIAKDEIIVIKLKENR